jgi:hypothetical protein
LGVVKAATRSGALTMPEVGVKSMALNAHCHDPNIDDNGTHEGAIVVYITDFGPSNIWTILYRIL